MVDLLAQKGFTGEKLTQALTKDEIRLLCESVPDWEIIDDHGRSYLRRTFTFPDFPEAVEFVTHVAEQCNDEDRPRILIDAGRVTIDWWTRSLRGLYATNFMQALRVDDIFARWDLISGHKDVVERASEESFPASDPPAW